MKLASRLASSGSLKVANWRLQDWRLDRGKSAHASLAAVGHSEESGPQAGRARSAFPQWGRGDYRKKDLRVGTGRNVWKYAWYQRPDGGLAGGAGGMRQRQRRHVQLQVGGVAAAPPGGDRKRCGGEALSRGIAAKKEGAWAGWDERSPLGARPCRRPLRRGDSEASRLARAMVAGAALVSRVPVGRPAARRGLVQDRPGPTGARVGCRQPCQRDSRAAQQAGRVHQAQLPARPGPPGGERGVQAERDPPEALEDRRHTVVVLLVPDRPGPPAGLAGTCQWQPG